MASGTTKSSPGLPVAPDSWSHHHGETVGIGPTLQIRKTEPGGRGWVHGLPGGAWVVGPELETLCVLLFQPRQTVGVPPQLYRWRNRGHRGAMACPKIP